MSSMFVTGSCSIGGCSGAGEGAEGTRVWAGESEGMGDVEGGDKGGVDEIAGEDGGEDRAGREEEDGVKAGDGDKGSGV